MSVPQEDKKAKCESKGIKDNVEPKADSGTTPSFMTVETSSIKKRGVEEKLKPIVRSGYMPRAFPGIHVLNMKNEELPKEDDPENRRKEHGWFFSYSQKERVEDLIQGNRSRSPLPEVSIDPRDGMVTITNFFDDYRCFYLSFRDRVCYDRIEQPLSQGDNTENDGKTKSKVTTFVIVLNPLTNMDVCRLDTGIRGLRDLESLKLQCTSNVSGLHCHPCPEEFDPDNVVGFPLGGEGPYLCTQGCNGAVTHYYGPSYHAIDLECPVGTPIVAVGDGVIKKVVDRNVLSGIKIDNLFTWNEVCLELDNGLLVDYIHIKPRSATVTAGLRVLKGQKICESGWVGFCPLPHLHIEFHRKHDPTGPSVKVMFQGETRQPFLPVCGLWYTSEGEVDAKDETEK